MVFDTDSDSDPDSDIFSQQPQRIDSEPSLPHARIFTFAPLLSNSQKIDKRSNKNALPDLLNHTLHQ